MKIPITNTLLPTTMVGSYPRPHWFTQQLLGRDIRVAFKEVKHEEAYHDATKVTIHDQEEAGLDIVTDGQMYFDDYVGVIGSFCWYMYERIPGFDPAKEKHPLESVVAVRTKEIEFFADWGGVINSGPVAPGPIRLTDLYQVAAKYAPGTSALGMPGAMRCPGSSRRGTKQSCRTTTTSPSISSCSILRIARWRASKR